MTQPQGSILTLPAGPYQQDSRRRRRLGGGRRARRANSGHCLDNRGFHNVLEVSQSNNGLRCTLIKRRRHSWTKERPRRGSLTAISPNLLRTNVVFDPKITPTVIGIWTRTRTLQAVSDGRRHRRRRRIALRNLPGHDAPSDLPSVDPAVVDDLCDRMGHLSLDAPHEDPVLFTRRVEELCRLMARLTLEDRTDEQGSIRKRRTASDKIQALPSPHNYSLFDEEAAILRRIATDWPQDALAADKEFARLLKISTDIFVYNSTCMVHPTEHITNVYPKGPTAPGFQLFGSYVDTLLPRLRLVHVQAASIWAPVFHSL